MDSTRTFHPRSVPCPERQRLTIRWRDGRCAVSLPSFWIVLNVVEFFMRRYGDVPAGTAIVWNGVVGRNLWSFVALRPVFWFVTQVQIINTKAVANVSIGPQSVCCVSVCSFWIVGFSAVKFMPPEAILRKYTDNRYHLSKSQCILTVTQWESVLAIATGRSPEAGWARRNQSTYSFI